MRLERMKRVLRERGGDSGVSIVELVVTIAVLSIVMTLIFGIVINETNASDAFKERTQEQADTRLVVDTFVRDLRQAYPGGTGNVPVEVASASEITFYSPDRDADFRLRKITYKLVSGALTRSVTVSTNTYSDAVVLGHGWTQPTGTPAVVSVLNGVTNTTLFTYLNQNNGTPIAGNPLVAVQLDLVVDQSPGQSTGAQTYRTRVDLRVMQ